MRKSLAVPAALLGTALSGMLIGVQSRINGGLGQELGSGIVAAFFSFGSGLVILAVIMIFATRSREGLRSLAGAVKRREFPVWGLIGGAMGAFFVLGQSLIAPVIGVALFTVGIVAGQVVGGLLIDRAGLGPSGRVNPTLPRLIGTALVIAAVLLSVAGSLRTGDLEGSAWLVVIPLFLGAGVAFQSAANGLVRSAAQSAISATFLSFVVGTLLLAVLAGVTVLTQGRPQSWPDQPLLYIGGVLGVIFIGVMAMFVRTAGVLLLGMASVAGQLVASVLLEFSFPLAGGVSLGLLVGASVALVAVVIAAIPRRASAG